MSNESFELEARALPAGVGCIDDALKYLAGKSFELVECVETDKVFSSQSGILETYRNAEEGIEVLISRTAMSHGEKTYHLMIGPEVTLEEEVQPAGELTHEPYEPMDTFVYVENGFGPLGSFYETELLALTEDVGEFNHTVFDELESRYGGI